jgi:small subunit ribosomal protein S20
MAKPRSAPKRLRISRKRAHRNLGLRTSVKTAVRRFRESAESSNPDMEAKLKDAIRTIDKVESKGAIHWKTAARKKSRIAKMASRSQAASTKAR